MIMMTMMMLDVLQEQDVIHNHNHMDDGRCFGAAKMFQVIKC